MNFFLHLFLKRNQKTVCYNYFVSSSFFGYSARQYKISSDVFSGPLDLLLQLIERAELDITKLSLAKVTDEYLYHLHSIDVRDPVEVSGFLVIAARLVLIKSFVLLPHSERVESVVEEDPGEVLARQLIIYKQFKKIAISLREREIAGLHTYLRRAPLPKVSEKLDMNDIDLNILLSILRKLFAKLQETHPLSTALIISAITLRQRINEIIITLQSESKSSFRSLLPNQYSRLEIIVTFLALLELIKHHNVIAQQENLFEDIALTNLGNISENIETEF